MLAICTTCDGLGEERKRVTHPAQNVYGWRPESPTSTWWRRRCATCGGDGYVEAGKPSVPSVPPKKRA